MPFQFWSAPGTGVGAFPSPLRTGGLPEEGLAFGNLTGGLGIRGYANMQVG